MIKEEQLKKYQATIGIECHVQLATKTKLFSGADNDERDKSPNSVVSPIDYALPGMLPVLNHGAVDLAIIAGKALNSKIANVSRFDRKHYFYPDLPKGYQISQMYQPIIGPGVVNVPMEDGTNFDVRINHAHLEEDAGKLTHHKTFSLIDLNRAGTPLIEIVSEPDMHSAAQARAYVTELYHLMTYAGVTRGDLYHGNMRFDVNVSVAPIGTTELGTRTEMKNLNSFRSVERGVKYEFARQVEVLERGELVKQETRGWDDNRQKSIVQRSKEDAQDYRYMPDADIPPIVLSDEYIASIQAKTPKLPPEWREILGAMGLDFAQIDTLLNAQNTYSQQVSILEPLAALASDSNKAKHFANWSVNVLVPMLGDDDFDITGIDYFALEEQVYDLLNQNKLSSTNAKAIFRELACERDVVDVAKYAADKGYLQVSNEDEIAAVVDEVLADASAQKAVADFKAGNEKVIGFLVGQVMKKSAGKANPSKAQELIRERLK